MNASVSMDILFDPAQSPFNELCDAADDANPLYTLTFENGSHCEMHACLAMCRANPNAVDFELNYTLQPTSPMLWLRSVFDCCSSNLLMFSKIDCVAADGEW